MAAGVLIFFAMATQWRWIAGTGFVTRVGLDYSVAPVVATAIGQVLDQQAFAVLRVLESEALEVWRRRG